MRRCRNLVLLDPPRPQSQKRRRQMPASWECHTSKACTKSTSTRRGRFPKNRDSVTVSHLMRYEPRWERKPGKCCMVCRPSSSLSWQHSRSQTTRRCVNIITLPPTEESNPSLSLSICCKLWIFYSTFVNKTFRFVRKAFPLFPKNVLTSLGTTLASGWNWFRWPTNRRDRAGR